MIIREGSLQFEFAEGVKAIKFDETPYYKIFKDCMPGNKGVDIIAYDDKHFTLIEIKDFEGYENNKENIKRLMTNSQETETLDDEVSQKVRSTVAAIFGSHINQDKDLDEYFEALKGRKSIANEFIPTVDVILFVEGDISKMVRKKGLKQETNVAFKVIQDSLKRKLRWLTGRVSVENMEFKKAQRYFRVKRV
ncbi:MAG: hypothetical protein GX270_13720 [Clostridiaceae bacterium]|jgi:hypothetical protein|nr:hypothetical protein [Clostridiaceae bacterium]